MQHRFKRAISIAISIFLLALVSSTIRLVLSHGTIWKKEGLFWIMLFFSILLYMIVSILSIIVKRYDIDILHPYIFLILSFLAIFAIVGFPTFGVRYYCRLPFDVGPVLPPPSMSAILISIGKVALLYCSMLFGMISDWIFKAIGNKTKMKDVTFAYIQLIKPMIVSPMIFIFIWSLLKEQPFGIVHLIVAYQNGFFWQSVFRMQSTRNQRQRKP